jgi:hypothetical protein
MIAPYDKEKKEKGTIKKQESFRFIKNQTTLTTNANRDEHVQKPFIKDRFVLEYIEVWK